MATNVKIVKLLTGEEIVAEVLDLNTTIQVKNPVRVIVIPNKIDPNKPNVGFAPWAEFSDDKTFTLAKSHVVCIMDPIKEFINQYNGMFGGIILNPNGPGLVIPGA